jgi:biopolymer transport protein ExbD
MRKIKVPTSNRPNSDINVTPLVDVVLVLLIIFMVVTPLLEKDIAVRIPNTEEVPEDVEPPPDQLVVSLDDKGGLFINSHPVSKEDYVETLRPFLDLKSDSEKLVFFSPDEKANYGLLVAALDGAKQAGATVLGITTDAAATLVPIPGPIGLPSAQPPPDAVPPGTPAPPPHAPPPHVAHAHSHPAPAHKKHR